MIKLFLGKLEKLSEDPEAAAQQQKTEGESEGSSTIYLQNELKSHMTLSHHSQPLPLAGLDGP